MNKTTRKLEKELREVETLKMDISAQKIAGHENKRVWVPESKEWIESYRMRGVQSWDEDTSHWEITPAHWEDQKIPLYEPDLERQKEIRERLEQMTIDSEFYSVVYAASPEEKKKGKLTWCLDRLRKDFEAEDAIKLFEITKDRRAKELLIDMTKRHGYQRVREDIKFYLRQHFDREVLRKKPEYFFGAAGLAMGGLISTVGTGIVYHSYPEFKEFMGSWGLLKGIGIFMLSTSGLSMAGYKIDELLEKRASNKLYKKWLKK